MPKIDPVPEAVLAELLGPQLTELWQTVTAAIEARYDMDREWHKGGKAAPYELKYRRGGKTLVSLFPKPGGIGLMVVLGKAERERFEAREASFSPSVTAGYRAADTYHDGKWIMYHLPDDEVLQDLSALLALKRKPNRK